MNPIVKMFNKSPDKPLNNFQQLVDGVKSGKIDAKQQSLSILQHLSPQQKQAVNQMIPQLKLLGKTFGIADENINNFINELNQRLK